MRCIVSGERRYAMDAQMKRGFLEVCVLASINRQDSYGYQIVKDVPHAYVVGMRLVKKKKE